MGDGFDVDLAALRRHAAHVDARAGEMRDCADLALAGIDQSAYGVVMAGLGALVGAVQSQVRGSLVAASAGLEATAVGMDASVTAYEGVETVVDDVMSRGRRLLEAVGL